MIVVYFYPTLLTPRLCRLGAYVKAQEENGESLPNISELAKLCRVSRGTILKIEGEIMIFGKVADPVQIIHDKHIIKRGHGVNY